ncbi:nucleotidyltransferase domain-containing protein [Nitrincola nitratireducens]|uniref:Putative nucleotidyltransferase n=1 Tax=Nitrincola nitratireducens TaxID=1229521 RepID=W9UX14_9GAMM|nr:nucleotidyltransferase domain-containing protein [Nitrincola nitratireducens]EXJ11778.1 putative nucleotidyltransferase [Nitrincola nitratireducens]
MHFGLNQADINKLCHVFSKYPSIDKVIVYGSRAKGTFRDNSDIDLTIVGDLDWLTFNELETELDDLLLPYTLDLSLYEQIENKDLRYHIDHVGQIFFDRQV